MSDPRLVSQYFYELARWREGVEIQGPRVEAAAREYMDFERSGEHRGEHRYHWRLMLESHFLLIAVRHVLRAAERIADLTGNEEASSAVERFKAAVPMAKEYRDLFEHIDEYLEGKGYRPDLRELMGPDGVHGACCP